MIPYLGNQIQYQYCLSGALSLVAFPMSVSNCASDNTLTGLRINFSEQAGSDFSRAARRSVGDMPVLKCSRVSKVPYSKDSLDTSSPSWKSD